MTKAGPLQRPAAGWMTPQPNSEGPPHSQHAYSVKCMLGKRNFRATDEVLEFESDLLYSDNNRVRQPCGGSTITVYMPPQLVSVFDCIEDEDIDLQYQ